MPCGNVGISRFINFTRGGRFGGTPEQYADYCASEHSRFGEEQAHHTACSACYDAVTHSWDTSTYYSRVNAYSEGIRVGDMFAIVITSCVMSHGIAQEVQEVRLSRILRSESKSTQVGRGWVFALATVDWLRQCVLVPGIGTLIPHLILQRGSDALNVCMNALAMNFILQCDNMAWIALPEYLKPDVPPFGVGTLSTEQLKQVGRIQIVYLVAVSVAIPMCLFLIPVEITENPDVEAGAGNNVLDPLRLLFLLLPFADMALMPTWGEQTIVSKVQSCGIVLFKAYAGSVFITFVNILVFAANHHLDRSSSAGSVYEEDHHWERCTEEELAHDVWGWECHRHKTQV
eukprot:COSAG05_NODE_608_length_8372_cov_2.996615_8_plen_345_part_00